MSTLTAANSILAISVTGLFPVPQVIQGYATDDAFAIGEVDMAEVMIGVDGKKSAGFTPYLVPFEITIQPDSPSLRFFEDIVAAQSAAREVYRLDGIVTLTAIGRKYVLVNGTLNKAPPMPTAKKILQPTKYTITWEAVQAANV